MPVDFTEEIETLKEDSLLRKRWTREECKMLGEAGLLDYEHLELIDGELIDKRMGKNRPHTLTILLMREWLDSIFGSRQVQSEASIDVSTDDSQRNDPEPDLAVLRQSMLSFRRKNPGPADIMLLVEVADSSLALDLGKKRRLYAKAGITEYWVADVKSRRLIVHRDPQNGDYRSKKTYFEHESVSPLAAPESEFHVKQAFAE